MTLPLSQSRIRRKGAGRKRTVSIPACVRTWTDWWILRLAEIRNRRFDGHARAYGCWPRNSGARVTQSVIKPWPSCYTRWITVCRPTRKSWEGSQHADRNRQFEYINRKAQRYLKQGDAILFCPVTGQAYFFIILLEEQSCAQVFSASPNL